MQKKQLIYASAQVLTKKHGIIVNDYGQKRDVFSARIQTDPEVSAIVLFGKKVVGYGSSNLKGVMKLTVHKHSVKPSDDFQLRVWIRKTGFRSKREVKEALSDIKCHRKKKHLCYGIKELILRYDYGDKPKVSSDRFAFPSGCQGRLHAKMFMSYCSKYKLYFQGKLVKKTQVYLPCNLQTLEQHSQVDHKVRVVTPTRTYNFIFKEYPNRDCYWKYIAKVRKGGLKVPGDVERNRRSNVLALLDAESGLKQHMSLGKWRGLKDLDMVAFRTSKLRKYRCKYRNRRSRESLSRYEEDWSWKVYDRRTGALLNTKRLRGSRGRCPRRIFLRRGTVVRTRGGLTHTLPDKAAEKRWLKSLLTGVKKG